MNNVIRIPINEEAHEKLRSIKKALRPEKRLLGEIASDIINNVNLDALIKAEKRRSKKEATK